MTALSFAKYKKNDKIGKLLIEQPKVTITEAEQKKNTVSEPKLNAKTDISENGSDITNNLNNTPLTETVKAQTDSQTETANIQVEGFKSLKIGKNIDECLKEGGFLKDHGYELNPLYLYKNEVNKIPNELLLQILGKKLYDGICQKFGNAQDNYTKIDTVIKIIENSGIENEKKLLILLKYSITKQDNSKITIGNFEVSEVKCYTFDDNILAITFNMGSNTSNQSDVASAFKLKYGEPKFENDGVYFWYNEPVLLLQQYYGYYSFVNVKKICEIILLFPELINEVIIEKDTRNKIKNTQNLKKSAKDL